MGITDMDRLNAVQQKLCEVKTWVDETLRILNYVCIDEAHKAFKTKETTHTPPSKAAGLYPGQLKEAPLTDDTVEECVS